MKRFEDIEKRLDKVEEKQREQEERINEYLGLPKKPVRPATLDQPAQPIPGTPDGFTRPS